MCELSGLGLIILIIYSLIMLHLSKGKSPEEVNRWIDRPWFKGKKKKSNNKNSGSEENTKHESNKYDSLDNML